MWFDVFEKMFECDKEELCVFGVLIEILGDVVDFNDFCEVCYCIF